jgi:hypothetical protein
MSGRSGATDAILDLVDEFCSGLIDEVEFERLESILLASREARDDFAEYVAHHAMIRVALGSRRAADCRGTLERLRRPSRRRR